MRHLILLICLSVTASPCLAETPSWFACYDSTGVEVHVPNKVTIDGHSMSLKDFVAKSGRVYARANNRHGDYLVLPIMLIGDRALCPGTELRAQVQGGKRQTEYVCVDAEWNDGIQYPVKAKDGRPTVYSMAVFQRGFRLQDVTGFTLVCIDGTEYHLTLEAALR